MIPKIKVIFIPSGGLKWCAAEKYLEANEKGSLEIDVSLIFFMDVWIPPLYTPNWMLHKGSKWAGHPDASVSVWLSRHRDDPTRSESRQQTHSRSQGWGAGPLLSWDGQQVPHKPRALPQASLLPFTSAAELKEGGKAMWGWWMILLGVLFGFFLEANSVSPVKCQPLILIAHKRKDRQHDSHLFGSLFYSLSRKKLKIKKIIWNIYAYTEPLCCTVEIKAIL